MVRYGEAGSWSGKRCSASTAELMAVESEGAKHRSLSLALFSCIPTAPGVLTDLRRTPQRTHLRASVSTDTFGFMPAGRPSIRTQEIDDQIISRLAEGETLRGICKDANLPAASTVLGWVDADPSFSERYARARRSGLDVIAEEIIDIADDSTRDYVKTDIGDGVVDERFDSEHVQRSRLRVDSRKWLLSKLRPDKYGDRIENVLSGSINVQQTAAETIRAARAARIAAAKEKPQ